MSRQRAESLLKQEDKEGCFVVRNSSTKGLYTLSLYTKVWVTNLLALLELGH
jgi:tyrosine-protein kinase Tec